MALHITLGCMYASKTTSLITKYESLKSSGVDVVVIDYDINKENKCYKGMLSNHDGIMIPCIKAVVLYDVLDIYKMRGNFQMSHEYDHNYDFITSPELYEVKNAVTTCQVIMINEAQFYDDLFPFVKQFLKKNKEIYIYGLDGDFKQEKIGYILDLIPLCDSVQKLKAECSLCKMPAIFSHRVSGETNQYQPYAKYISLCRKCNE